MSILTTFSITSSCAGTRFTGEFQSLSLPEPVIFQRPRKRSWCFGHAGHKLPDFKCFMQVPETMNLMKPTFALRKDSDDGYLPNVEDTDEMFDELFNKYGKVVFRRNDQKPASAEVDDDAESLSFAVAMAKVASETKAADIKVLFVKPLVYWTRFFIIATAFSRPQIDAIGFKMRDLAEKKYRKVPSGDTKPNSWTLLDFGDVVVHIFLPQQRTFYNLEEFYGNATPIDLPFENQPPFQS